MPLNHFLPLTTHSHPKDIENLTCVLSQTNSSKDAVLGVLWVCFMFNSLSLFIRSVCICDERDFFFVILSIQFTHQVWICKD